MNEKIKKVFTVVKEKTVQAGSFVGGKTIEGKDFIVSRFRKDKEVEEQLNEIGQLLLEANTRMELEDLARDLKAAETTIRLLYNRAMKIYKEL